MIENKQINELEGLIATDKMNNLIVLTSIDFISYLLKINFKKAFKYMFL